MGPKEILYFWFVAGTVSYSPGAFPCYVRATALKFSCEQGKLEKNVSFRNTAYPQRVGLLKWRHGIGSTEKLQLWREFWPCLNEGRAGQSITHGNIKMAIGLERLSSTITLSKAPDPRNISCVLQLVTVESLSVLGCFGDYLCLSHGPAAE